MIYVEKYDKNYDESLFITKVDHIFIMILSSIMDNDMTKVKHYLSDEIYQKFDKLVESYKEKKVIRLFDEMNVKSTSIDSFDVKDNTLNVYVTITSRYMDYFLDSNGEYVSGVNDHRIEMKHNIVFSKKLDAKGLQESRDCPSCGNSLDINATGVCPYCGMVIDMSIFDYIITDIDTF
jgi:predicted lipid-binding transport protein (Tim44 family)